MTHCTGTLADRSLEQYIQGTLPESEAQQFEEHYFDCPECLRQVEALQAVALKLGSQTRKAAKAPIPWPVRVGSIAAIAAMLVVGFFGFRASHRTGGQTLATAPMTPQAAPPSQAAPLSHPATPSLASAAVSRLADLALPAFQAPNLRGQNGDLHFDEGMKAYTNQDYAGAIKALSQVPAQDPDALAATFYSGVCQMHEGDLGAASRTLQGVADAGDSPQQEAAFYYLAQVALARNDAAAARHYLAHTVSLHGDFEQRAHAELIQVR
jgi:tetratricopeptide (TPR) repeat protein